MESKTGIQYDIIQITQQYSDEYLLHLMQEESAELIQAINKWIRFLNAGEYTGHGAEILSHLYEEIADNEILIQSIKNRFACENEVYDWKKKKLKRWKERQGTTQNPK